MRKASFSRAFFFLLGILFLLPSIIDIGQAQTIIKYFAGYLVVGFLLVYELVTKGSSKRYLAAMAGGGSILALVGSFSFNPFAISGGGLALGFWLAGLAFLAHWLIKKRLASFFFASGFLLLIILALSAFLEYGTSPEALNQIFPEGSRNAFLGSFLTYSVGLTVALVVEHGRLTLWPALLVVLASFLAGTRGPIAVSVILFLLLLGLKMFAGSSSWLKVFSSVFLVVGIYVFSPIDIEFLFGETKYYSQGLETPRFEMWEAYLRSLTGASVIFGQNIEGVSLISTYWGGNPHNAFIKAHSIFGIMPLLILVLLLFFRISLKDPVNRVISVGIVAVLLRGVTDITLVGSSSDIVLAYLLLSIAQGRSKSKPIGESEEKNNFPVSGVATESETQRDTPRRPIVRISWMGR